MSISDQELGDITEKLCGLFEAGAVPKLFIIPYTELLLAVIHAQQSVAARHTSGQLFDTTELGWFSKNSYNVGLKHATEWEPRKVLRMLQSCLALISLYLKDIDQKVLEDLSLRQMFCDFLGTVLLISLATGRG